MYLGIIDIVLYCRESALIHRGAVASYKDVSLRFKDTVESCRDAFQASGDIVASYREIA